MSSLTDREIAYFIEPRIKEFHEKRIKSLLKLKLKEILSRKNPYLFKAKNLTRAQDLVRSLLDAHLSSQEEGIFGGFLEELAIFICSKKYGGNKSSAEGIDLEFKKNKVKYIVSIKSGPHWGNSQQISRMKDNFRKTKKILGTNARVSIIIGVNGCCYGRDDNPDKGDYIKLCGQRFWEFISGNANLYTEIVEPLGHKAKEKNKQFKKEYDKVTNKFTREFSINYCDTEGEIQWEALVHFNSARLKNVELRY